MKWFRHHCDLSQSDFVKNLQTEYGLNGYARYIKTLELVAGRMTEADQCDLTLTWAEWEQKLAGKRRQLQAFFEFCHEKQAFIVEATEQHLKTKCPELLNLRDFHSKNLQATGKKTPSSAPKTSVNPVQLFTSADEWAQWFRRELSYTERKANSAENQRQFRLWIASNVTTEEVCQAVDIAIGAGSGIEATDLHTLVAQIRKQKLEEAKQC
ncbi:hypothetical protein [Endozoicomonas lisbonensis]|uniref:hypothetical protein n=1 Tax=Endozoicomonas lisbonensis TaxID=3120522 RepID=UPI003395DD13